MRMLRHPFHGNSNSQFIIINHTFHVLDELDKIVEALCFLQDLKQERCNNIHVQEKKATYKFILVLETLYNNKIVDKPGKSVIQI